MKVYGASLLKGLGYTLKTFVNTYVEDFKRMRGQGTDGEHGMRTATEGAVTVQYPESPMPIGSTYERFRVLPMLVYDQKEDGEKDVRCTSCGICAKVCPPQCIWIVQETDEKDKPVPNPEQFYIDTSVCMNCALCSEYCPFDAIKMDHQFALNVTENRQENYLYDLEKLLVPAEYYAELHPKANAAEEEARRLEAEAKAKKAAEKAARLAAKKKAAAEKAAKAKAEGATEAGADTKTAEDPEREAKRAAAKERAAARKAKREAKKAEAGGEDATSSKEDPERAAKIAAAKEKAAAIKAEREAKKAAEEKPAEVEKSAITEKTRATVAKAANAAHQAAEQAQVFTKQAKEESQ